MAASSTAVIYALSTSKFKGVFLIVPKMSPILFSNGSDSLI